MPAASYSRLISRRDAAAQRIFEQRVSDGSESVSAVGGSGDNAQAIKTGLDHTGPMGSEKSQRWENHEIPELKLFQPQPASRVGGLIGGRVTALGRLGNLGGVGYWRILNHRQHQSGKFSQRYVIGLL